MKLNKYILSLLSIFAVLYAGAANIKVMEKNGKYLLSIPEGYFDRDLILGSRIVSISEPSGKVYAAGQLRRAAFPFRFEMRDGLVAMRAVECGDMVQKSDRIAGIYADNHIAGYIRTFRPLETVDSHVIIDVSDYFSQIVAEAWPLPLNLRIGKRIDEFSGIRKIGNHDDHVNIRTAYCFGGEKPFSVEVQYFIMDNGDHMPVRFNDERIGFLPVKKNIYSSGKTVRAAEIIAKWRIEPSEEDMARYMSGEKVVPEQRIIFYIDPAFPESWVPYIKEGLEYWNMAFEEIGFKDVIEVREFPDDADFDPYDIKTNVVRYVPNREANAAGMVMYEPVCGEIVGAEILWWNDVVSLLKSWRFLQTAAADEKARNAEPDERTMGEMVRYSMAHEMGHVLGMQHNLKASYAYPSDSLRSVTFTRKYGTTASIMDYARFNHVADSSDVARGVSLLPPAIGPFDYLSVAYAYLFRPGATDEELNREVFEGKENDPFYSFSPFVNAAVSPDPSAQTETLGNSVETSSMAGIRNMKILLANLDDWTFGYGGDIALYKERYDAIFKSYFRYINLLGSNLCGRFVNYTSVHDTSARITAVTPETVKENISLMVRLLAEADSYLLSPEIMERTGSYAEAFCNKSAEAVDALINNFVAARIGSNLVFHGKQYGFDEFYSDVDKAIWDNLSPENPFHVNMALSYMDSLLNMCRKCRCESGGVLKMASNSAALQLQRTEKYIRRSAAWKKKLNIINPKN